MKLDAIKALPVAKISAPDAVLYLWALPHMIAAALEVMAAWGFDYRTQMIWGKDQIGIGQWVRNQHEPLLIGRRGSFPPPPESVRSSSLVMAAQRAQFQANRFHGVDRALVRRHAEDRAVPPRPAAPWLGRLGQ